MGTIGGSPSAATALAGGALACLIFAQTPRPENPLLWQARNLGKAFYENPTTQKEAVEEFRKARALSPNSVREIVNYGLALLRAGDSKQGVAELQRAQKLDPSLPHTWFNLGITFKKEGNFGRGAHAVARDGAACSRRRR